MSPVLLVSRLHSRLRVLPVFRRSLTLSCRREAELIINHPHFQTVPYRLAGGRFHRHPPPDPPEPGVSVIPLGEGYVRAVRMTVPLLICLAACALLTALLLSPSRAPILPPQDWSPVSIPSFVALGNCRQDRSHRLGVIYRLPSLEEEVRLALTPGGGGVGRLVLYLDDKRLPATVTLPEGWGDTVWLTLPASSPAAEGHRLAVVPDRVGEGRIPSWGVRDVRMLPVHEERPFPEEEKLGRLLQAAADPLALPADLGRIHARMTRIVGRDGGSLPLTQGVHLLEQRLHGLLDEERLRFCSLLAAGSRTQAMSLLESLAGWIPESWAEGRETLDGMQKRAVRAR